MLAECDVNIDILYLVDCQAGLTKIDRWIDFGCQDPIGYIMRAILERVHARANCGAAIF